MPDGIEDLTRCRRRTSDESPADLQRAPRCMPLRRRSRASARRCRTRIACVASGPSQERDGAIVAHVNLRPCPVRWDPVGRGRAQACQCGFDSRPEPGRFFQRNGTWSAISRGVRTSAVTIRLPSTRSKPCSGRRACTPHPQGGTGPRSAQAPAGRYTSPPASRNSFAFSAMPCASASGSATPCLAA